MTWTLASLDTGCAAVWPLREAALPLVERISGVAARGLSLSAGAPEYDQAGPAALDAALGANNRGARLTAGVGAERVFSSGSTVASAVGLTGSEWSLSVWFWRGSGTNGQVSNVFTIGSMVFGVRYGSAVPDVPRQLQVSGAATILVDDPQPRAVSDWSHAVIRRSAGQCSLWVDGVQIADVAASTVTDGLAQIGTSTPGEIRAAQLAVWSRALTADEITALAAGTAAWTYPVPTATSTGVAGWYTDGVPSTITLSGTGLDTAISATIGGVPAVIQSATETTVVLEVPGGISAGFSIPIVVSCYGGDAEWEVAVFEPGGGATSWEQACVNLTVTAISRSAQFQSLTSTTGDPVAARAYIIQSDSGDAEDDSLEAVDGQTLSPTGTWARIWLPSVERTAAGIPPETDKLGTIEVVLRIPAVAANAPGADFARVREAAGVITDQLNASGLFCAAAWSLAGPVRGADTRADRLAFFATITGSIRG